MTAESQKLDQTRTAALGRIERAERNYRLGIAIMAVFEAICVLAFLFLMDFHDRLHWLLLLAAVLVYGIVIICIVNLGKYVNSATQTILSAIFAEREEREGASR